jgi:uncharacterized protein
MEMTMKPSRYNLWHKGENGVYLYNVFSTGLLALDDMNVDKVENVLKDPSKIITFSKEEQEMLIENGFLVAEEVDEIDMVKFRYRQCAFDKSRLYITMIPTKACNLACVYCFEHDKNHVVMSNEDCTEALKFFEKQLMEIRPQGFNIIWYGGEPLLALDIIETISRGADEICKKLDIPRDSDSMITNGYLLDEKTARKIKDIGIDSLQITLDGNREEHNRRRVLKNGEGTFDRICEAIGIARRHFKQITVRINTNKSNLPGIQEMLEANPLFKAENIGVNIGPLKTYLGGTMTKEEDVHCFQGPELQQVQDKINILLEKVPQEEEVDGPHHFLTRGNNCGADQLKCFVIGPGAHIYSCYERVDPGEEVGSLKDGVFVPNKNYWKWAINEPFEHKACLSCLYLPACMGGCPSIRKRLGLPNSESCGYWKEWLNLKLRRIDRANRAG